MVEIFRRQFRNADPAQPLRHDSRDALRQMFVGPPDAEWMEDVLIIVSELVQNVSQHTDGPGELIITLSPGTVLIEVGDLSTAHPYTRHPAPGSAGGRGLLLIETISQQWGVRTCADGKVVWARLPVAVVAPHLNAA